MGNSWCVRGVLRICMAGVRRWGEGNAARHHVAWVERSEARGVRAFFRFVSFFVSLCIGTSEQVFMYYVVLESFRRF